MLFHPFAFGAGGSAAAAVIGLIVYVLLYCLVMAFCIACYVLESFGLFSIARRRKLRLYGLAWVPVANYWLLGQIGDHYRQTVKGKKSNLRVWLLVLCAVTCVMAIVTSIAAPIAAIVIANAESGDPRIWTTLGISAILVGITAVFTITLAVLEFIAYHRLYVSCRPDASTTYTVLSILFPVVIPFFVFACRKYDDGMIPLVEDGEQTPPAPEPDAPVVDAEIVEETPTEPAAPAE